MSDLKIFISGYKSVGHKFIPFIPDDNLSLDFDSSKVLISNVEGFKALLKGNFLMFICELTSNQSWQQFVESYLLCRKKSGGENIKDLWELDKLIYLAYLRLVTSTEVSTLDILLPRIAASTNSEKGSKRDQKAESDKGEEDGDRRQQILLDQYKQHLAGLQFLRAPSVLDLVAVLSAKNVALSSRLVKGLYDFKLTFAKEVNDTLKESVKALDRVHQSVIILSRKMLERKSSNDSNKTKICGSKTAGLSVMSQTAKPSAAQEKQSKLSAAEELVFLSEFGGDIVHSVGNFLLALQGAGLLTQTSLLCLSGTRLTGTLGLSLVRGLQNLYEVLLPLLARCSTTPSASSVDAHGVPAVDLPSLRACLGTMQVQALRMLDTLLTSTLGAAQRLQSEAGKSYDQLFDSMDILREDAIEWLAVFQGHDPLGRDPLVLSAISSNAGELVSSKITSSAVSGSNKGNVGGVVHSVDESEVLRGVFLADYMRVYGTKQVEAVVVLSDGGEADPDRLAYVLKSLQVSESLLRSKRAAPTPTRIESVASYPVAESKSVSGDEARAEGVKNIKAIFPDLGEGFIEACIAAYKGNIEEVIDALLTDNLQPTLLVLDRSLQKMWRGKGGNATQEVISLDVAKRDKAVYKEVEDAEFKRMQKERILKMEQQQEMDHMLLMREYNDDYDDQYDEYQAVDLLRSQPQGAERDTIKPAAAPAPTRPVPVAAPSAELLNRREKRKGKSTALAAGLPVPPAATAKAPAPQQRSTAEIHQQMAEMKRFNTLTRDAEAEDAFWEGMRNTNKHSSVTSGKGSWKAQLAAEEEAAAEQAVAAAGPSRSSATGPPSSSGGQTGRQPQPPRPPSNAGGGNKQDNASQQQGGRNSQPKPKPSSGEEQQGKAGPGSAPKPNNSRPSKSKNTDGAASVDSSVASEDSKKHRTKPFDKHHQKDRANRKFSHFAPQT